MGDFQLPCLMAGGHIFMYLYIWNEDFPLPPLFAGGCFPGGAKILSKQNQLEVVEYPVNRFCMTMCQFLSLKLSMARMFQHDPYDPHQKGSPHHRNIQIVLGESDSWGFLLKCPLKVGWVSSGKWWNAFRTPQRISWWAKGGQNSGWAKTMRLQRNPRSWTRDWTGDLAPCFNCRSLCIFESVLSLWTNSGVQFLSYTMSWSPKNGTPKYGTRINIETENGLETNQWYSCMTFWAQNIRSPRKLRNDCSLRKDVAGICNRQIQYHSIWGFP